MSDLVPPVQLLQLIIQAATFLGMASKDREATSLKEAKTTVAISSTENNSLSVREEDVRELVKLIERGNEIRRRGGYMQYEKDEHKKLVAERALILLDQIGTGEPSFKKLNDELVPYFKHIVENY